ncbi:MAG: Npt1/Npt2 family nucleotide transporter [Bacteroidota bacterium]
MKKSPSFGFIRRNFFPIHNHELNKFLPLSLIFFFISFNYAILRGWKDVFVIGMGGSEAVAACKLWGVLPTLLVFNIIYNYISQRTNRIVRFNMIIGYFFVYFTVFLFLIYPARHALELKGLEEVMKRWVPLRSFDGLWMILRYWPVTMFYIHAEGWGVFALSVLFYTFANEIVNIKQSGRFYPFLAVSANIATALAGVFMMGYLLGEKPSLQLSLSINLVFCLILMGFFSYFAKMIEEDPARYEVEEKAPKKKAKLSVAASLKVLFKSTYLLRIGFIVIAYNVCINLFEAIYKDALRSEGLDLQYYAGLQLFLIGGAAIIFSLFFATPAMKIGWRFVGSITPVMLMLSCVLTLFVLYLGYLFEFITKPLAISTGYLGFFIALMGVVFIKGSKYTFFDPFKENAYIPLSREERSLGKASVETLSRWGKAGGSLLITGIIAPLGGVTKFRLPIGVIVLIVVATWLVTVQDLSSKFYELTSNKSNDSVGGNDSQETKPVKGEKVGN